MDVGVAAVAPDVVIAACCTCVLVDDVLQALPSCASFQVLQQVL
jgi:hypothetical protein